MFIVRSAAYVSGSIAVPYFAARYSTQTLFIAYFLLISSSLFICSLSVHTLNLALTLFVSGFCFIGQNILTFSLTIKIFRNNNPEVWVVLLAIAFGTGANLAPLFAIWFELYSYKILSGLALLTLPILFLNPLPNVEENTEK